MIVVFRVLALDIPVSVKKHSSGEEHPLDNRQEKHRSESKVSVPG